MFCLRVESRYVWESHIRFGVSYSASSWSTNRIKRVKESDRHQYGEVEARTAFLLALEGERGRLEVHPVGGEREGLRRPTASIQQGPAIGADLAEAVAERNAACSEPVRYSYLRRHLRPLS